MLKNGTKIKMDDEKKSEGVIIGTCLYTPSWSYGREMFGYLVESENYQSIIIVHPTNILEPKESE